MVANPYKHTGSQAPYYDDFDVTKNYMRIMYNPAKGVQGRELTQSQTILQNQIAALGGYTFKDGSIVSGGNISYTYTQPSIQIKTLDKNNNPISPSDLVGHKFTGAISGQMVIVTGYVPSTRYILFSYLGANISSTTEIFNGYDNAALSFVTETGTLNDCFFAACSEGIIFVDGYFCNINREELSIKLNSQSTDKYHIGYHIQRSYVSSVEDSTLNDPAAGSYNYNAPGADRYKIKVSLFGYKEGDVVDQDVLDNFIPQIIVNAGKVELQQTTDPNGVLMDAIAKRTYDESGSYCVSGWDTTIAEHATDVSKFVASVSPGIGYIKGYKIQNLVSSNLTIDKPRTSMTKSHVSQFKHYDTYTKALVDDVTGAISGKAVPSFIKNEIIEVMSNINGTGTILGECKLTNVHKIGTDILLFLRDTSAVQNLFPGAKSVRSKTNPTLLYINLKLDTSGRAFFNSNRVLPIVKTPFDYVKSVTDGSIYYEEVRSYVVTSEASGNILNLSEADTTLDFPTYSGLISIYNSSTGSHININSLTVVPNNSGSVSTATISGATISNSTSYTVLLQCKRTLMTTRTKNAVQATKSISVANGTDIVTLDFEDCIDIVSIVQTSNTTGSTPANLKSYLTFNNGQTPYIYDYGTVSGFTSLSSTFRSTPAATTNYTITYRYYNHIGQGPLVPNSYVTVANATKLSDILDLYAAIPTFIDGTTIYDLKNCIDFRVKGSVLSATGYYQPAFGAELVYDCDIYLPRVDTVWVNSMGTFGITYGIPSESPEKPKLPSDVFAISDLEYRPYLGSVKQTSIKDAKIKRFTMEDIGKLDTRIKNVENVVSLSQLEQSAINMKILDSNGFDRYKSGIFTDGFSNWNNSNYTNPEYTSTIDEIEQSIRSQYDAKMVDFVYNAGSSTTTKLNGVTITLPYSSSIYSQNTLASESMNVQKLLFYTWDGTLKLSPSIDNWVNDLGNIIVKTTYTEIPKPPTSFRSWSTTTTSRLPWSTTTTVTNVSQTTTYADAGYVLNSSTTMNKSTVDKYLRERVVTYVCSNLRPGVAISGTIDGIPLTLSNSLPDASGSVSGTFTIPSGIPVGTKLVVFSDASKTSIASATYTGNGITTWRETSLGYIRQWYPIVSTSSSSSSTTIVRRIQSDGNGKGDPLAQSFYVAETSGIYIDSIDVFFKTKDSDIPVEVYLVEMDNGYPTENMLPFARKQLAPSSVNLGINTATNFKFSEPIYLQGLKEYAFVVKSSSLNYAIYTSTIGKADINSGIGIAKQPVLGSLFSSQNASTWTAEQLSDIKYNIKRCVFTTNTNSNTIFDIPLQSVDWEVAMQTITANTFIPNDTSLEFHYKWKNDAVWTKFENGSDIFNATIQTLTSSGQVPLSVKLVLNSTSDFVSPQVDTEDIYSIFAQNTLLDRSSDAPYIYTAGTYISNEVVLTNPATDIRVILDMIAPGYSDADVYFQTYDYKPIYANQATVGLCIDTAAGTALNGQTCQLYYYNNSTKNLEPKSKVIVTGYDTTNRKLFMRSVGNPDEFVPIQNGDGTQTIYTGISANYTALIVLPVLSSINISCVAWTATSFTAGTYVTYANSIWKARTAAVAGNTPSDLSLVWEKINGVKTITTITPDTTITWRKMTKGVINNSINTLTNFVEYTYSPAVAIESDFSHFSIKVEMKSRNKIDIPRVKNLRAIATV